jgi:hypothetical protein
MTDNRLATSNTTNDSEISLENRIEIIEEGIRKKYLSRLTGWI